MSEKMSNFVWIAARSNGDFTKMVELMDAGECDANVKMQQSGETFLHIAASHGDLDTCKYLIDLGAILNSRTNQDLTPLYLAARHGKAAVVDFLAREGADLDAACSSNAESKVDSQVDVAPTAIHIGAVHGHLEVLRALIKNDVNQLAVNSNGETALHLACLNNQEKAALLLMKKKRAVAKKNANGKLAIDIAVGVIKAALEECSATAAPAIDAKALAKADPAAVKVFGKVVMSAFMSQDWKQRVSALKDATDVLVNWDSARSRHIAKENIFEGACRLLELSIEDKVPQVFYAVMPLLKELFNGNIRLPKISGDDLHPSMEAIIEALLKRAESAQARSQKEAKRAILFLAKDTDVGSAPIAGHLYSFDPSTVSSWRPMHARLSVLLELVKEFKLSELSGIRLAETVDLALPGLENTSVQVRKLSMDILCLAGGFHIEQAVRSSGTPKATLLREFLDEYLATAKPAVIKMAKSNLDKILGLQTPKKPRSARKKKRTKSYSDAKAKATDEQLFVKELTDEDRQLVASVIACFKEKVGQYLLAKQWNARKEAIKMAVEDLKERGKMNGTLLKACGTMLELTLTDKVEHVCASGLKFLRFVATQSIKMIGGSESFFMLMQCSKPPLLPVVIARLGNSKPRFRTQAEEAIMFLAALDKWHGVELIAKAILASAEDDSKKHAAALVGGRLNILSKLLDQAPFQEGNTVMNAEKLIMLATESLEERDRDARAAADGLYEATCRKYGRDVLAFLPKLSENAQLRLKACLAKAEMLGHLNATGGSGARPPRASNSGGRPPRGGSGGRNGSGGANSGRRLGTMSRAALHTSRSRLESAQGLRACDLITTLPQAEALAAQHQEIGRQMIPVFGESLARCAFSTVWTKRKAALTVLQTRIFAAVGLIPDDQKTDKDPLPEKDVVVVDMICKLVSRATQDRVSKVYETALVLINCLVDNYVPTVKHDKSGLQDIFRDPVRGMTKKLGERNDRVKVKSQESLLKICRCSHIGPGVIATSIFDQEDDSFVKSFNGPAMVGLLRLLVSMVSEFGVNDDTQLVPDKLMRLIVPALESKHLDVRTIGTELYAALYNNVGDAADYMNGLISHLSARLKNQLTDAVSRLRPADATPATSPSKQDAPKKGKRNSIVKVDLAVVTACFGEDIAKQLTSDDQEERTDALRQLSNLLQFGEALAPTADSTKAWDICCRVVKQGIMSNFTCEILQSFRLLRTLANAEPGMELEIPWSAWEARLVLGSIVKSVIDRVNDRHVRVRESAQETAVVVAQSSNVGLTLVARHALAEVSIPKVNPSSPLSMRRAYGLVGNNLVHRLRIIRQLVQDYQFSMSCTLLTLESVLKYALNAWKHKSGLVATTCKTLCAKAMSIAGSETALHYISTLPVEAQVKLRPLLPQMSAKQLDVERYAALEGDGGDLVLAEHGGSVRGPQFSPISTKSQSLGLGAGLDNANTYPGAFPGADLESPSFNGTNLPTSGRIRPRRRSRFRTNERDNMTSAPDSVNARLMHEAPAPPSSAPFGHKPTRGVIQEHGQRILRNHMGRQTGDNSSASGASGGYNNIWS